MGWRKIWGCIYSRESERRETNEPYLVAVPLNESEFLSLGMGLTSFFDSVPDTKSLMLVIVVVLICSSASFVRNACRITGQIA